MPSWLHLPPEVKQIIFSYIIDARHIVFIAKDHLLKNEVPFSEALKFHNLLLVSKKFLTPHEFRSSLLNITTLNFYTAAQFRQFIAHANPAFKQSVRQIRFVRSVERFRSPLPSQDEFGPLRSISTTLRKELPSLQKILVTAPDEQPFVASGYPQHLLKPGYCTPIGSYRSRRIAPLMVDQLQDIMRCILKVPGEDYVADGAVGALGWRPHVLKHAVAKFIGDRTRPNPDYDWDRPCTWISRLVRAAEEIGIEAIFEFDLCVNFRFTYFGSKFTSMPIAESPDKVQFHKGCCISSRSHNLDPSAIESGAAWPIHTRARMSTKDYMLKYRVADEEYQVHQQLAFDMLHVVTFRSQHWWSSLLRNAGFNHGDARRRVLHPSLD